MSDGELKAQKQREVNTEVKVAEEVMHSLAKNGISVSDMNKLLYGVPQKKSHPETELSKL